MSVHLSVCACKLVHRDTVFSLLELLKLNYILVLLLPTFSGSSGLSNQTFWHCIIVDIMPCAALKTYVNIQIQSITFLGKLS